MTKSMLHALRKPPEKGQTHAAYFTADTAFCLLQGTGLQSSFYEHGQPGITSA